MKSFTRTIIETLKKPEKIKRDSFVYLSPKAPKSRFAQCGTCMMFRPATEQCAIFGPNKKVSGRDGSCGMYEWGKANHLPVHEVMTPEQAGYVERQVRCGNCYYGGPKCGLYMALNKALPEKFDLEEEIEEFACCNAQTPKS